MIKANNKSNILKRFNIIFALIPFFYFLYLLDLPILSHHSFRQTQTALYVLSYDLFGFEFIPYLPLFGYPWKVPLEFPIFQILSFFVYKLSFLNIDNSGRIVSLIFYYLSILPINKILKMIGEYNLRNKFYFLYFTSPLLLFFSSSFLIETTLMFFMLLSTFFYIKLLINFNFKIALIFSITLSIAGLIKITCMPALMISYFIAGIIFYLNKKSLVNIFYILIALIFSSFIPLLWSITASNFNSDSLMLADSEFVPSSKSLSWLFGTVDSRLDINTYFVIFVKGFIFTGLILPFIAMVFIVIRKYLDRTMNLSLNYFFALFVLIPFMSVIIFFNLYYVHDYYFIALVPYMIFTFLFIFKFMKDQFLNVILILNFIFSFFIFSIYYLSKNEFRDFEIENLSIANYLKGKVSNDEFIIIDNNGNWNPIISYYSNSSAIYTHEKRDFNFIYKNIFLLGKGKKLKFIVNCNRDNDQLLNKVYGNTIHITKNCGIWKTKKLKF